MRYAPFAMALLLAGCAQIVWDKTGATQADFNRESYMCERDARQSGYFGGGLIGALNMAEFAQRCMVAQGWAPRRADAPAPANVPAAPMVSSASDAAPWTASTPGQCGGSRDRPTTCTPAPAP